MKTVKSTTVIALFAAVALFAASCGGGNSKKQSGDVSETKTETKAEAPSTELRVKDVNKNNWQAVIKATRDGVDIPLPDGWTVEDAKPDRGSYVQVIFKIGGSTNGEQFGQILMDATKTVASNGNHKIEITENGTAEGEAIEKINEANMVAGEGVYEWCFTAKYIYQFHYYADDNKKQATFSF